MSFVTPPPRGDFFIAECSSKRYIGRGIFGCRCGRLVPAKNAQVPQSSANEETHMPGSPPVFTWIGPNGGTFNVPANWSSTPGGVPGAGDEALINVADTVYLTATATIDNLSTV